MSFVLLAALIVVAVCAFLILPLWFGRRAAAVADSDRQAANLAIFRDELADLERERQDGTLAEAEFDHARQELQRRLLDETTPVTAGAAAGLTGPSRKTAIALLLLLPLGALLGYVWLGTPVALDPARTAPAQAGITPEQITEMVARLAERMKNNPDDVQGWLMLARSYDALGRHNEAVEAKANADKVIPRLAERQQGKPEDLPGWLQLARSYEMLDRYDDAANAYAKAEKLINDQPDLLARYAETLSMAGGKGGQLAGKPRELLERALKINPQHMQSLYLAGVAAVQAKENQQAIGYWEALLPQLEPGSDDERMVRDGIDKLKQGK